ncbi:hypothetical protein DPMN_156471, partial [Dreissena polymorpha]
MSVKQYLCGPCLEEKGEIEGVVYCTECEEPLCDQCKQDHARIKVSKHHTLCDIAAVPPPEIKELLKTLIACPNHESEEAVYLCKDHDMTCCHKCAMADHRKCEEVKVLADILHDTKADCSALKAVLHDLQQQGERLLDHERQHEELVSEIESEALSSLQTIKQKLLDMYVQLENNVLSAIADKKKVIIEKLKTNNEKSSQFLKDVKQQSTYIEHVEKFGTHEHVVLLQRRLEKEPLQLSVSKRKGQYDPGLIAEAYGAVKNKGMSVYRAARLYEFQRVLFVTVHLDYSQSPAHQNPYQDMDPKGCVLSLKRSSSTVTILAAGNAIGSRLPPLYIFSGKRKPSSRKLVDSTVPAIKVLEKGEIEGVVYCRGCEEPLCGRCKQEHARINVSKHHQLSDLADVPPQEIQDLLNGLIACPAHDKEDVVGERGVGFK